MCKEKKDIYKDIRCSFIKVRYSEKKRYVSWTLKGEYELTRSFGPRIERRQGVPFRGNSMYQGIKMWRVWYWRTLRNWELLEQRIHCEWGRGWGWKGGKCQRQNKIIIHILKNHNNFTLWVKNRFFRLACVHREIRKPNPVCRKFKPRKVVNYPWV